MPSAARRRLFLPARTAAAGPPQSSAPSAAKAPAAPAAAPSHESGRRARSVHLTTHPHDCERPWSDALRGWAGEGTAASAGDSGSLRGRRSGESDLGWGGTGDMRRRQLRKRTPMKAAGTGARRRPTSGSKGWFGVGKWEGHLRLVATAVRCRGRPMLAIAVPDGVRLPRVPLRRYRASMTDEALIAEAGRRLAAAAPAARVILFGSRARGEGRSDSDLDLLVIEPELKSRRAEFVRLREALGDLGVPIDLIVLSAEYADQRAQVRGSMVNEALHRGRVLAGA